MKKDDNYFFRKDQVWEIRIWRIILMILHLILNGLIIYVFY